MRFFLALLTTLFLSAPCQAAMVECRIARLEFDQVRLKSKSWDLDGSLPDLYAVAFQSGQVIGFSGEPLIDKASQTFPGKSSFMVDNTADLTIRIYDADKLQESLLRLASSLEKDKESGKIKIGGTKFLSQLRKVINGERLKNDDLVTSMLVRRASFRTNVFKFANFGGRLTLEFGGKTVSSAGAALFDIRVGRVAVRPKKSNGKAWDIFGGKPDLLVSVSVVENGGVYLKGETSFKKDSTSATFNQVVKARIPASVVVVSVYDKDLKSNDLVGSWTYTLSSTGSLKLVRSSGQILTLEVSAQRAH